MGPNCPELPKMTHKTPKWSIMTHNKKYLQFGGMLDHFGQFWGKIGSFSGHFRLFWDIWGHFYNYTGDHINEQKLKHDLDYQML